MKNFGKILLIMVIIAVSSLSLMAADDADLLFREGSTRFERGDYAGAAERYRDFLRRYPGNDLYPEVLYRLGISRIKTGDYREGVDLLERLEARYPGGRFRTAFWLGFGYQHLADPDKAISALDRYISSNDTLYRREAMLTAAYLRARHRSPSAAEPLLVDLAEDDQLFFVQRGGLELLGEIYRESAQYDKLIKLESQITEVPQKEIPPGFLIALGEAYQAKNNNRAAETAFRRALEEGSSEERTIAYGRLFSIYEAAGDLTEMEELILDAEDRLAGDRKALAGFWFRVGAVLSTGDNPARGLGYLKRAWDVRGEVELPGTLPLFYAKALIDSGDTDGAIEVLETALAEDFGEPNRIRYRLAAAFLQLKQWEKAAGMLEANDKPLDSPAALIAAQANLRLKRYDKGLEAVAAALESGPSAEWQRELLKVAWRLQAGAGEYPAAVKSYSRLKRLEGEPEDEAPLDLQYARLLFNARLYDRVLRVIPQDTRLPEALVLRGMALIGKSEYREALEALESTETAGLNREHRSAGLYYLAWSYYRLGDYQRSLEGFDDYLNRFPDSPRAPEAAYYGGWAAFSLREYDRAAELFGLCDPGGPRGREALIARARAKAAGGRDGEAILLAERYIEEYGFADRGDEALYLVFDIHLDNGDLEGSAAAASRLYENVPEGIWSSRALYRQARGELEAGNYEAAAEGFDSYRRRYPRGEYAADALFYRAEAALKRGETRLALLFWERLIREYPRSTLRPRALSLRGQNLVKLGDYRGALDVYGLLLQEYPAQAERLGVADEVARLESLLVSSGSQYRRLIKEAEAVGGLGTPEGRKLLIEAVQSAIAEGRASEFSAAGGLVRQLMDSWSRDPEERGRILFLAGEYAFRRNEYADAASRYLQAASIMPDDPDFTAQALYRSAQMSLYAGDRSGYREVLNRLRESFPGSPWLEAAEQLGGNQ